MCLDVMKENLSVYCVFPLSFECVCVHIEVLHGVLKLFKVNIECFKWSECVYRCVGMCLPIYWMFLMSFEC